MPILRTLKYTFVAGTDNIIPYLAAALAAAFLIIILLIVYIICNKMHSKQGDDEQLLSAESGNNSVTTDNPSYEDPDTASGKDYVGHGKFGSLKGQPPQGDIDAKYASPKDWKDKQHKIELIKRCLHFFKKN